MHGWLADRCKSCTVGAVSTRKIVCAVSLASFAALAAGFILASDVRAGELHEADLPTEGMADADRDRAAAFAGEYTYVGGQKERDGITAAIETTVASLNPMVRSMGRKRLEESNPVPKHMSIELDGDDVTLSIDGDGHRATLGGPAVKATSKFGDKIKVSYRMRGDRLTNLIDGVGGDRLNTLRLSEDGKRVTLDVEITSGHFDVPVEYRLTFKRK